MHNDLSIIFKKFFKTRPEKGPTFGSDPREDWKKIVIFFLIINFCILAFSGYLFWQINQGSIFEVAATEGVGADKTTLTNLKNTMNFYDSKEKQFEDLREAKPPTADPAL